MSWSEDPDRALERWAVKDDERLLAGERADRVDDHTPADSLTQGSLDCGASNASFRRNSLKGSPGGEGRRITSAMSVLAWTVLNGSSYDAREASKVLAELVLEADG